MAPLSGPRRRLRSGGALAAVAFGVAASGLACTLHQAGVTPPDNRVFFPSGAIVDPQGDANNHWLYVVNSNSDLRYNAGTVVAIDLVKVEADYDLARSTTTTPLCSVDPRFVPAPTPPPGCCWDRLDPSILNCDDQAYIDGASTVRIGSFGGYPAIQDLPSVGGRRLFVPVRGDTSITMMALGPVDSPSKFFCTGQRQGSVSPALFATQPKFSTCDANWRITREQDPLQGFASIPSDQVIYLPDEPYALAIDQVLGLLYVGHLVGGYISIIDLGDGMDNQHPTLENTNPYIMPGDANGNAGVTALTIRNPGTCGEVFATSRYRPVAESFVVGGLNSQDPTVPCGIEPVGTTAPGITNRSLGISGPDESYGTGLGGSETRGIEFIHPGGDPSQSPDRAFILQRTPPALVGIDINAVTPTPYATLEVCQGATSLAQPVDLAGQPLYGIPLLFVTCFDAGEIYVVDPAGPQIRAVIPIGRGPIITAFDSTDSGKYRAYVVGFGENDIAVLDLDPASAFYGHVVQRIGYPSATPRDIGPQ